MRENKCTEAEYEKRIALVSEMLLSGMKRRDIIQNVANNENLKWDVSDRQIDTYIHDATIAIKETVDKDKDTILTKVYTRYDYLYKKLMNVKDYKGAMLVTEKIAQLTGIIQPVKSEVSTTINVTVPDEPAE